MKGIFLTEGQTEFWVVKMLKEINLEPNAWLFHQYSPELNIALLENMADGEIKEIKPPYAIRQKLYVKEAWKTREMEVFNPQTPYDWVPTVEYKDGISINVEDVMNVEWWESHNHGNWRSPALMPAWAARKFVEVTDVKAQRLQEIRIGDAIKVGFSLDFDMAHFGKYKNPITKFKEEWDPKHPKHPWSSNPWCWHVTVREG